MFNQATHLIVFLVCLASFGLVGCESAKNEKALESTMENPIYLITEATKDPAYPAEFEEYVGKARTFTAKHGGSQFKTFVVKETLQAGPQPTAFAISVFPNSEAVKKLFDDPEYKKLIPMRDKAFSEIRYFLTEELSRQ